MDIDKNKKVVVRMAPSPTGYFHIGSVRTALFNYLFAKQNEGTFIFRSEDTNDERSKKEYEDNIIDSLKWLGLSYDVFMRQSDRKEVYVSYLQKMIDNGSAYISKEEPKEDVEVSYNSKKTGERRSEVIRLKNPNKKIVFEDLVRGTVEFDTTESGDFVIAKSLTEPLYHLAVVVDDFETGATHVIRGEDILSSTPRQILIQEAIGAPRPIYAHIPLILAPDRSKLSKRFGATSLVQYKEQGFLPSGILNYMAMLGWNPGTEQEIFTLDELIKSFDITQVQKGGAIFDMKKLEWVNKEHIKRMPIEERNNEILNRLKMSDEIAKIPKLDDKKFLEKISQIIFEHISKWGDIDTMLGAGELSYFFEAPSFAKELMVWKDSSLDDAKKHLEWVKSTLENAPEKSFESVETVKSLIFDYATQEGRGNVLWPLRVALSGKEKSPDPFTLLYVLGKEESISRVDKAIKL